MLTRKQRRMLTAIEDYLHKEGVAPSYEDLCAKLNMSSKSSVHRLVRSLAERGYIRRLPNRARAIEVLQSAKDTRPPGGAPTSRPGVDLPLLGYVAAGEPVVVWEDEHNYVGVPASHARDGGDYYALRVRGDSMIGAGILNDDIVVVRSQQRAGEGEIVVALVNGQETTLKRLIWDDDHVVLRAENPAFEDIRLHRSQVEIQGRVTGLQRRYD